MGTAPPLNVFGKVLVAAHEVQDDFVFGGVGGEAVGCEDGAVIRRVSFAKFYRHC